MMAESLDARKHERKATFDVPLPIKRKDRDVALNNEALAEESGSSATPIGNTMTFSLLTKRGNRQHVSSAFSFDRNFFLLIILQTRTVELPSDSAFAVDMKTKQAAEREEQQRIKNLVLNYDLRDTDDQDGEYGLSPIKHNPNIHADAAGIDKAAATNHTRPDKSSNNRSGARARKLQLSDVDWYDKSTKSGSVSPLSYDSYDSGTPSPPIMPSHAATQRSFEGRRRGCGRGFAQARSRRVSRKEMLQEHASRAISKLGK